MTTALSLLHQRSANALHHRSFVFYWLASSAASFAVQVMAVSVGWQINDISCDPLDLGFVGLAQFLPPLLLVLVTGLVADTLNRRLVMGVCLGLELICAVALLLLTLSAPTVVWPVFVILVGLGLARAFFNPSSDALAPNLLPKGAIADGGIILSQVLKDKDLLPAQVLLYRDLRARHLPRCATVVPNVQDWRRGHKFAIPRPWRERTRQEIRY